MQNTATLILDTAQELIQTRGYSAMSFQDIANEVGIKKPSIIHHFATKSALGISVIERYKAGFSTQLVAIQNTPNISNLDVLRFYISPFLAFAETPNKVCLCGALSGEILALPPEIQAEVKLFMENHLMLLEEVFSEGKKQGDFHFDQTPAAMAQTVFGALQGALLVKRTTGDTHYVNRVAETILAWVTPKTKTTSH